MALVIGNVDVDYPPGSHPRTKPYFKNLNSGVPFQRSEPQSLSPVSSETRKNIESSGQNPPPRLIRSGDPFNRLQALPYAQQYVFQRDSTPALSEVDSVQSSPQSSYTPLSFHSAGTSSGPSTPFSQHSFSGELSSPPAQYSGEQPRIQVSSLLTDLISGSYHLEVIQHPQKTAEFGTSHTLSRLPLTPPLIVKLTVRDQAGMTDVPEEELPFLVAHLSLFSEDGAMALDMGTAPGSQGQDPPRRLLYGNLVSSAYKLEDLQGDTGVFFLFSDISIRWHGNYQLGITLLKLPRTDSTGMGVANRGIGLAHTRTRSFSVVSRREYTAAPQTRLTQCFLRQGVRMLNFQSST